MVSEYHLWPRVEGVKFWKTGKKYVGQDSSITFYYMFNLLQFFKMECYDEDGNVLHRKQIVAQLRNIVERSTHAAKPVGILTTQNRNVWGKAYKKLRKSEFLVFFLWIFYWKNLFLYLFRFIVIWILKIKLLCFHSESKVICFQSKSFEIIVIENL